MSILNRQQFAETFNEIMRNHGGDCNSDEHVLWEAEKWTNEDGVKVRIHCYYFIRVTPIKWNSKFEYWDWVAQTLKGETVCYSSDDMEKHEWWGFTEEDDISIFCLRWCT